MATTPATSTPHALFARAAQFPDAPAYHTKAGDSWKVLKAFSSYYSFF
jgi:hypothetical protein